MNKKWLWLAPLILAPSILVLALDARARKRRSAPQQRSLAARWKLAHAKKRAAREFLGYLQIVRGQIQADMERGKRVFQRAGILDENGALTEQYRGLNEPENSEVGD